MCAAAIDPRGAGFDLTHLPRSTPTPLQVDISDDGSVAAFAAFANNTDGVTTARAYVIDGQSGVLRFVYDLGASVQPLGGGVQVRAHRAAGRCAVPPPSCALALPSLAWQVSEMGQWLAFTNGDVVYVLDTMSGKLRNAINTPYGIEAAISNDGSIVVAASPDTAFVYVWSNSSGTYQLAHSLQPPSTESWYPEDLALSTDGTKTYFTVGWIDSEALTARITVFDAVAGTLLSDIITATNAKLQTVPTVRADRNYVAACFWGDSDDVYTVALLRAGDSSLTFNYTTPGSMFGVDVVVDDTDAAATTVYLAAAGKHVPANMFGNGGDAYAWRVTVPA